jgi:hypothetical protein
MAGLTGKGLSFLLCPPRVVGSYRLHPAYPALARRGTYRPKPLSISETSGKRSPPP